MALRGKVRRRGRQREGRVLSLPRRVLGWLTSARGVWVIVSAVLAVGLIITYFPSAFLGHVATGGEVQVRGPGEAIPSMGNAHLPPGEPFTGTYNSDPPTSGPHWGVPPPFGVHSSPIPREVQVHALEDGGVVINYDCELYPGDCQELVRRLEEITRSRERVLLAPYDLQEAPIALTAWQRLLNLEEYDRERILQFIRVYEGIDHHVR